MTGPHINEIRGKGKPHQACIGHLKEGISQDSAVAALAESGIVADRVYFLFGDDGIAALESSGNMFTRIGDLVRTDALESLRKGDTLIGVFDIASNQDEETRRSVLKAGAEDILSFGTWTYY